MGNLMKHAKREMEAAGFYGDDMPYGKLLPEAVEELIAVFEKQGHSGMSAGLVSSTFSKLASFEPLTPLTRKDDEWERVQDDLWQNKRYGSVFKGADGRAYDIDGKVFVEPSGAAYTSKDSRVFVEFPYAPTTEYVHVEEGSPVSGGAE